MVRTELVYYPFVGSVSVENPGFAETIAKLDKSPPQIRDQKSQIELPESARRLD